MIDAHHHCWQLGRNDCTWPTPELTPIYMDQDLDDYISMARAAGVTGSILVQSQASDADTDYLLRLARQSEFVKAVVGWVDLASVAAPARIAHLARQPKLRGLRPMLQAYAADNWILSAAITPAIQAMMAQGLCFDALVSVRHLPALYRFAALYPDLPLVIDHAAKPAIAAAPAEFSAWQLQMSRFARLPHVYCKLSGLLTEAGAEQGMAELQPYIQHLYHEFGAERLMWGSDWPVLKLAANNTLATYSQWLSLARGALAGLSVVEFKAVLGRSCLRFYKVE